MSLAKQEFTNVGRGMLGRAQHGETLHISKLTAGSGTASQPSDLWPLLQPIVHEMDFAIVTALDYGNGTMLVEGNLSSAAAPHLFLLRELGVLAHIGTEADQLYSISNVFTDTPITIDPAAPTIQVFKIKLIIDRVPTAGVTVTIGAAENVTGQNIGAATVGPGPYHDTAGNVLSFKRLVQGTGMDIHDSTDGNSIYIGTATLTQNVDLYVPANNPDVPINPATSQPYPNTLFASIQAAHDYLLGFRIPAQYTATIHVHELNNAIMTFTPSITISHPDGKQIAIIGQPRVDYAVTRIAWVSNLQKDVTLTDVTGLAAGMYVWIAGPVANPVSGSPGYAGGCQIASVNTSTKVVRCNIWNKNHSGTAYNVTDTNANRLSRLPTRLQISPDPTALGQGLSFPNGISSIQNILIIAHSNANLNNTYDQINYLAYAFNGNGGSLINCMAVNARRGLSGGTDTVTLSGDCVFSNDAFGIVGGTDTEAYWDAYTFINGCGQGVLSGGRFALGSIIGGNNNTAAWINHNEYGVNIGVGCNLQGGTWWALNNWRAIQCTSGGSVSLGAGYGSYLLNNGLAAFGFDIYAQGMSYVRYDRWTYQMPTCSPPVSVLTNPPNPTWQGIGNQNACIYILDTGG